MARDHPFSRCDPDVPAFVGKPSGARHPPRNFPPRVPGHAPLTAPTVPNVTQAAMGFTPMRWKAAPGLDLRAIVVAMEQAIRLQMSHNLGNRPQTRGPNF